jgi:penicillin-binding protein activator
MKSYGLLVCLLVFGLGTSMLTTGCKSSSGSTRVDVRDDTKGPRGSGPYAADAREVTEMIVSELRRQQVLEDFQAEFGEAPIVVLLRPRNQTRFPEVTQFFQQDFVNELMATYTRREVRFVVRDEYVLSEIAEEEAAKEAGELTDRRGRRTRLGVDYFVRANFVALSRTDGRQDDDTILYTYEFIDAATSELVFSGGHHIRRVSERSAVYR